MVGLAPCTLALFLSVSLPQAAPPQVKQFTPTRYELAFSVDYETQKIEGTVRLTARNYSERPAAELPLLLHRLMSVTGARNAEGAPLPLEQDVVRWAENEKRQVTAAAVRLGRAIQPGDEVTVALDYEGFVTPYTEIGWLYVRDHVDEDFTIIRPDALAYPEIGYPSSAANRGGPMDAFDYRAAVTVPAKLYVANGGHLVDRTADGERATFVYENMKPAWRMDFAIADYGILQGDALAVYYLPGDSVGAAGVLGAAERSITLYTDWFGPLQGMPRFSVLEIPDGWGSQADVTSILQTAAAFNDPERYGEVYHETAHLWHVAGKAPSPRWEEGLATYLQFLLAERLDGRDVLDKWITAWEDYYAGRLPDDPEWARVPMADYGREGMTGHSYRVGAFMFYALHQTVGDEIFGRIVGDYRDVATEGEGTSEAFARHASRVAGRDLSYLFDHWLFTTGWAEALAEGSGVADFLRAYGTYVTGG